MKGGETVVTNVPVITTIDVNSILVDGLYLYDINNNASYPLKVACESGNNVFCCLLQNSLVGGWAVAYGFIDTNDSCYTAYPTASAPTVRNCQVGSHHESREINGVTYYLMVEGYRYTLPIDYSHNTSIVYNSIDDVFNAMATAFTYPITYHYTNSTVSGPSEAAVGDTITVSAVPDVGYGITDASTQILVTNNDVAVPYTWDATNQRITFTMPEGAVTVSVTGSLIPTYPITYRPTRVTLSGPATAAVGATVNVDCAFPEGYGVKTTDTISVTCNRTPVSFSWDSENQRITFTMPDPTGGGE